MTPDPETAQAKAERMAWVIDTDLARALLRRLSAEDERRMQLHRLLFAKAAIDAGWHIPLPLGEEPNDAA